jgi:hypothetical protein
MRWVGHVACMRKMNNAYNILVGKLGRRCENNLRMDLGEMDGEVWTGYLQLRIGTSDKLL